MDTPTTSAYPAFLNALGLHEEPMGIYSTDNEPETGMTPEPTVLPDIDREKRGEVDWENVFGNWSCSLGHIWRARRKKQPAWFSRERFGCLGAAFWLGFLKPQLNVIVELVSTGAPNNPGEFYCSSARELRRIFDEIDPTPVPAKYLVFKPLSLFAENENPEFVAFFTRPEPLCALHQLAFYVTDDPEVVVSPWGAACGGLWTWPAKYAKEGKNKAVLGGWDPSARKFYRPDELSFTVPFSMFQTMVQNWEQSFMKTETWKKARRKAELSDAAWTSPRKKK